MGSIYRTRESLGESTPLLVGALNIQHEMPGKINDPELPSVIISPYTSLGDTNPSAKFNQLKTIAEHVVMVAATTPLQIGNKGVFASPRVLEAHTVVLAAPELALNNVEIDAEVAVIVSGDLQVANVKFSQRLQKLIVVANEVAYSASVFHRSKSAHNMIAKAHESIQAVSTNATLRNFSVTAAEPTKDGEAEKIVLDQEQLARRSSQNGTVIAALVNLLLPEGTLASHNVTMGTIYTLSLGVAIGKKGASSAEPLVLDASNRLLLIANEIHVGNVIFESVPHRLEIIASLVCFATDTPPRTRSMIEEAIENSSSA